jgi:sulfide:quinone oxidoreductase
VAALLPTIANGRILIGICGSPYKCPPAPSEAALLLHDYLTERGVRNACKITIASPLATPVPPSPETSSALLSAFAERDIAYFGDRDVGYDIFLGVPKHRAPDVVQRSGLTDDSGYISVNPKTLATRFPGVFAFGDCAKPPCTLVWAGSSRVGRMKATS